MQLNLNNKSEERALSAYEMEQARINQIEKEKERQTCIWLWICLCT